MYETVHPPTIPTQQSFLGHTEESELQEPDAIFELRRLRTLEIDIDDALAVEILANDVVQSEMPPLQLLDTHLQKEGIVSLGTIIDAKLILQILFKAHTVTFHIWVGFTQLR